MLNASKKIQQLTKVALILSIGFFIGFFASQTKSATENPPRDIEATESINLDSIVSYTTDNGTLTLNTKGGGHHVISVDNTIHTYNANECIPLTDVAYAYKSTSDYWCFELKDVTHQLDDFSMPNYNTLAKKVNSSYISVTWNNTGVTVNTKDGDIYTMPR